MMQAPHIPTPRARHLTCAETAKLVRAALKKAFPGIKFSVRSETYAGGASIRVDWVDGPIVKQVDHLVQGFASARFDGMIDMQTTADHWLMPDGSVSVAFLNGTDRSMGTIPTVATDSPGPGAEMVHFGAHYVFTTRRFSPEFLGRIARQVAISEGCEPPALRISSYDGCAEIERPLSADWQDISLPANIATRWAHQTDARTFLRWEV